MSMHDNDEDAGEPATTALYDLHIEYGARLMAFSGFRLPLQYRFGILHEHRWTRESASLFDVSHMGQAVLKGPDHRATARALQAIVPGNIEALRPGAMRYSVLLNESGGIIDDLVITRPPDADGELFLVSNAGRRHVDHEAIATVLPSSVTLEALEGKAMLAIQGPEAARILSAHIDGLADMAFMSARHAEIAGIACLLTRSGYTGEDGFEISLFDRDIEHVSRILLRDHKLALAGLGARDTLRLEAGLCLYGHDLDETTSPFEAGIGFVVSRARLAGDDLRGTARLRRELETGPERKRVGLAIHGRAPMREGAGIFSPDQEAWLGRVTSGGFSPSLGVPVACGYVRSDFAETGTELTIKMNGRRCTATVCTLPFMTPQYYRPGQPPPARMVN